jgi:ribosomal protein L2
MIPGEQIIERIEYDPNRSAHLALLRHCQSGVRSYMIAAVGMRAGDKVTSYRAGISKELLREMGGKFDPGLFAAKTCVRGNTLPVKMVPPGTQVYCVGSSPERGAVFCRSAGTFATVIGKSEEKKGTIVNNSAPMIPGMDVENYRFMVVKLQSGEIRRVHKDACATIGVVSNPLHRDVQLGKAGRSRWLNIRPTVRGLAMNACEY